ncbi:MAG TPA: hypothetical protein EYQ64_14265, partial [Gemmatimonadetes bacterium]|nr:hypothetical protein [Gemmatimonadota bacterium]
MIAFRSHPGSAGMTGSADPRGPAGERDLRRLSNEGRIHFMGVAGAGMCALAELFANRGGSVSGCDLRPGSSTDRLRGMNVQILEGHDPSHVEGACLED